MEKQEEQTFAGKCRTILNTEWQTVVNAFAAEESPHDPLPKDQADIREAIIESVNSGTKSYRYVLPTQLVAKLANPSLDCHSLQAAWGSPGAFDARTIAHKVIVPFDRANQRALGGAPEPYVNNPLRNPAITSQYRASQKDKPGWDLLCQVLDTVQQRGSAEFARQVFQQVLFEIQRRVQRMSIAYAVPNRVSFEGTMRLLQDYLATSSGGARVQAVAAALFRAIGAEFKLYEHVRTANITASDVSLDRVADIECLDKDEHIVLAVEVKDRTLTLSQLDDKLTGMRSRRISELLFLAQRGIEPAEKDTITQSVASEFSSGQNVYITDLEAFSKGVLMLLGEKGRATLLEQVGGVLDECQVAFQHRKAWADLLRKS